MSATKGRLVLFLISGIAFASSISFTADLDMSHPASSRALICSTTASISLVLAVVIDWIEIGESPPIATSPT